MSQNEIASFANFISSSGPGIEQQVAQGLFEAGSAVVPGWDLAACVIGECSKTDWALAAAGIIPVGKAGTTLIKVYNKYGDVVGEALVKYGKKCEIVDVTKKAPDIKTPYKRPSGATTKAQRESVQGKPCVDCGATTPKQYADHKDPLVKEYYRTGTIDKMRMRDVDSVQSQCPTCSNKQGAEMSQFSRQQKKGLGL